MPWWFTQVRLNPRCARSQIARAGRCLIRGQTALSWARSAASAARSSWMPGIRRGILSALQAMLATPLDSDHLEIVEAFLAGLSKSVSEGG